MIRGAPNPNYPMRGLPRMRGDDPTVTKPDEQAEAFAPHARG